MRFYDIEKYIPNVPVDLLKVDIEGSEEIFVESYPDLLARTKRIVIEFHNGYCDVQRTRNTLLAQFPKHEVLRTLNNNTTEMFSR